ncbi:SGNH hydrolase-type esterase domain-containing protein [Lipomyces arxii]|uniref:SGNH hydrolase-type esterase domain-containing protein n=1 Tax=Lipomyces arxii TaxID=56418 RepID=UPI0034CD304D
MALQYDKILFFGDSITQYAYNQDNGFCVGPALQDLYTRKLDVVQRGFSGYNSDHAALMIDKIIEAETTFTSKIRLMIVFFGTNDSVQPKNVVQHVPIQRFKQNMHKIYDSATKAGSKVIFIGPGPLNAHVWKIGREDRYDDRTTLQAREYCDAAISVGKELGAPVIPLWYAMMADLGWKEGDTIYGLLEESEENPLKAYLNDGLHFAGPGYKVEFNEIVKAIKENYPELDPDNIPMKLPLWDQITSIDDLKKALE